MNILIADDHPVFRSGLRQAIEEQPGEWRVQEAGDGEEAVRVCQSGSVDVAFLDISMPKLDGLGTMRRLREANQTVRTIVLTMYDDAELIDEVMDLGAYAFVLKDDAIEDILQALQLVLAGKKLLSPALYNRHLRGKRGAQVFDTTKQDLELLTRTERKVLQLIADDLTSKEIADRLGCSVHTINAHRQNMGTKLGLNGTHSLLKFAYAHRRHF